ncbi:MAG: hypothetical protein KKE86_16680 [Planctomycetes bacterium]|nr:hypothetical protein [Planctomycetota bacterium]MBU4400951.1 hypothetical protein [Planctomycetota bacterium]MCG2682658.1 hypothetical protein [Planctomycetales bacterium]
MHQPQFPRRFGLALIAGAILLPVCICVTLGVAVLLEGMGDIAGGVVLRRIVLAGSVLWIIDLVCLLLVLAIGTLRGPDEPDEP